MTRHQSAPERTRDQVEAFLRRFFGPGNDAWPGMDPDYTWKDRTSPFVDMVRHAVDAPVVLPRINNDRDLFAMYVIARDPADAAKTADLITAFAGPTYSSADRGVRPADLDPDDPVDKAVLDFAGPGVTFTLRTGMHRKHRTSLVDALLLMQRAVAKRPPRLWHVAKPVGRLLAEFEAALAAGGEAASRDLLEHLSVEGGISATNLAYLEIKRLSRLGRSDELLALPRLADVVRQDPPAPVQEAILGAVYSTALEEPLSRGDLLAARVALVASGRYVPHLMYGDVRSLAPEGLTVLLLAATVREDISVLERLVAAARESAKTDAVPQLVWNAAIGVLRSEPGPEPEVEPQREQPDEDRGAHQPPKPPADIATLTTAIGSWPDLITAIADGRPNGYALLDQHAWASWASPAIDDRAIAGVLDNLGSLPAERVWRVVGAFIDAVGYAAPAGATAHAFIRNALAFDRFSPGDLTALQALTEITLRNAPEARIYVELLDDIRSECDRWVAPERAPVALDFVDCLVLAACPDPAARDNLAYSLLGPLWRHNARLQEADLAFARRLSRELDLEFVWPEPADEPEQRTPLTALPSLNVLLYSLDEAVLARSADELRRLVPTAKVVTSHDQVGGPQLRQKAQRADLIVLATRCAKHAATGFISQQAGSALIEYADGSGSASLLRAAVAGMRRKAET